MTDAESSPDNKAKKKGNSRVSLDSTVDPTGHNPQCPRWRMAQLSGREREVALLIREALSNKEIARRLHISGGTVGQHLHRIYEKVGVRNRTALASLAMLALLG